MLSTVAQQNSSVTYSNDENNKAEHSMIYTDDNGKFEIKYTGDIGFNEEGTAVESVSDNASLTYKKDRRSISISKADDGKIMYKIDGIKKTSLDEKESAFLASAIKVMIEHGVGAKVRADQLYKKGGSRAVFDEIANLKTDYVKAIYLRSLLENRSLSAAELTEIANKTGSIIRSDYEKANLLSKFATKYLSNEATMQAYLDAITDIRSDYEKANTIKHILDQPLTAAQFSQVLQLAKSIRSDYEKANVMKQVLAKNKITTSQFSEVLNTTATLGSDYEKANVLKAILENNKLPEAQFTEALNVISKVGSDFEKANILKQVAKQKISNESQWVELLTVSEKISSDYEKANVLVAISEHMPMTDNVKSGYMKTAKTISSDHEYGRVVRAIK